MKLFLCIASIVLALVGSPVNAFSFQAWNLDNYAGKTTGPIATKGHKDIGFWANSYQWTSPLGDGCCIRFCSDKTSVGHWCSQKFQPKSSAAFNYVSIGCGSEKPSC